MLARCGRVAHICEANQILQSVFPAAIAFFETQQKSKTESEEPQLPLKSRGCNDGTRFQGQLRFPRQAAMCPSLAEPDAGGIPRSKVFDYKPQAK